MKDKIIQIVQTVDGYDLNLIALSENGNIYTWNYGNDEWELQSESPDILEEKSKFIVAKKRVK